MSMRSIKCKSTATYFFLMTLSGFSCAFLNTTDAKEPLQNKRTINEIELRQIAKNLAASTLKKDPNFILSLSQSGLPCVDSKIPYEAVKKSIRDKESYAYKFLYDPKGFETEKNSMRQISFIELLQKSKDIKIEIKFEEYDLDWGHVTFTSPSLGKHILFSFIKEGSRWHFADGDWFCNSI